MSPKELWTEYTYNELLARLHFRKQEHDEDDMRAKRMAYYNLMAINRLLGEESKAFDDIFPAPKPPTKPITPEERKAEFAKHKLVLVEE